MVILAGDHVYKMDYLRMVRFHQEMEATVTLAAIEIPVEDGRRFGIVAVDDRDRVTGFAEKPRIAVDARAAAPGPGVDGHLRLQQRRAGARTGGRRRGSRQSAHFGGTSSRRSFPADGCARMPSTTRTRRPRNTGATSARWMRKLEANMDLVR